MKHFLRLRIIFSVVCLVIFSATSTSQTIIAEWKFTDVTKKSLITNDASFRANPYTADDGIIANKDISKLQLSDSKPTFTGWVNSSDGSSRTCPSTNGWEQEIAYWIIEISTEGYNNINVNSIQNGSNTGPKDFSFEYSINGTEWTKVADIIVANNFTSGILNVTLPETCNNQSKLFLRWKKSSNTSINNGTVASTGTNRIDRITITSLPDITQVNTPEFTPTASNQLFSPIDVSIQTSTTDAVIFYSLVEEPYEWQEYSEPISVSETTSIWAYAQKTGLDNSEIASATYTFPTITDVSTIAELRSGSVDNTTVYKLTGEAIITFKTSFRNQKFIQDASGAIQIDDLSGKITTNYVLGDGFTGLVGTLNDNNNMLQFVPAFDPGEPTQTSGYIPNPEIITLNELDASYQGKLVKVLNVTITNAVGNFANSTNYPITDESGVGILRNHYNSAELTGNAIPNTKQDITGIILQYQSDIQLVPRSMNDFEPSSTVNIGTSNSKSLHIYPNPVKDILYIEVDQPIASVEIMNTVGNVVSTIAPVQNTINTSALPQGVYLVKITTESGDSFISRIVKQ
ncbi:DUF5689 domain-containing protein [Alkaliflexus imshenetskii]|uniref:DUF5689 domain-containing protein n=1 Tax=Alkaliflexus imshenetskii TaxID=286730 RepID=UPI00047E214D|nr:DUF5689 domain-containing protein [Alkaliflexus imshenetskii]